MVCSRCGWQRCRQGSGGDPGRGSGERCLRIKVARKAMKRIVQSKRTKATQTMLTHFTLNAALPTIDMATDLITAVKFINKGHLFWGLSIILCMFLPFSMKFGMLISESIKGNARRRHIASLFLGIPFVNPLKQTMMAARLALLDPAKKQDKRQIEAVVKDASLNSLYEAVLEAGPQLLIQMHIVLSTGEISPVQALSMMSSLITLSLAASRGFFVQRGKKYADPEPSPQMIFWVFLPMLVLVVSALISWSTIGGLVKEYTVLVILVCVAATWLLLWLAEKRGGAVAAEAENLELGIEAEPTNTEDCKEVRKREDPVLQTDSDDKEGKLEEENVAGRIHQDGARQEITEEAERNENKISPNSKDKMLKCSEEKDVEPDAIEDEAVSPDVVVITVEGEPQAGNSSREERRDSICGSIYSCFFSISRIVTSVAGKGRLCWHMSKCCQNLWLLLFCGVCCIFKRSAREKAFIGKHLDWLPDEIKEDKDYLKSIKSNTYLGQLKNHFMKFSEKVLVLTANPVESEEERYFRLKSSLCSQWVPCVVGNIENRTFPVSAAVSITVRTIALLGVVLLAAFDYPVSFQKRTTILFCQTNETLQMDKLYPTCQGISCLSFVSEPKLSFRTTVGWNRSEPYSVPTVSGHKYRICSEENTLVYLGVALLTVSTILSIVAALRLHHLSTYLNLHKASTSWPSSIPCSPIAHRSLISDLIEDGNSSDLASVLRRSPAAGGRQDAEGISPINFAIKCGQSECLEVLLAADVEATDVDGTGKTPAQTAVDQKDEECLHKLIQASVKMYNVCAQIIFDKNELNVVFNDKLKLTNINLEYLKQLLVTCELEQTGVRNGEPCLLKATQDGDWLLLSELFEAGVEITQSPNGHLPISCHLDGLATHPAGQSTIVQLVQVGRLDLLWILLNQLNLNWNGQHKSTVGVNHQLINKTELSVLMSTSSVETEARREALTLLAEHDLLVLPPSNFNEGEAEALALNWNANEGVETVAAEEQIWQRGKKAINLKTWSDRDCEGELRGLGIRTSSTEGITQIRSLHGSKWSDWRDVGSNKPNDAETELVLQHGERIRTIKSWFHFGTGALCGIEMVSNIGREFSAGQKGGDRGHHLVNGRALVHMSGALGSIEDKYHPDGEYDVRRLTFHWVEQAYANVQEETEDDLNKKIS